MCRNNNQAQPYLTYTTEVPPTIPPATYYHLHGKELFARVTSAPGWLSHVDALLYLVGIYI